jgi:hypothetical protein
MYGRTIVEEVIYVLKCGIVAVACIIGVAATAMVSILG